MRCKKHLPDLTSTIGVCASCLRERLDALLEAQAQAQAQAQPARAGSRSSSAAVPCNDFRKPEPNPPPLNFPRSVSPYVSRRKSDRDCVLNRMFYSTPQVGPGFSSTACDAGRRASSSLKKRTGKFWMLSSLFRPRSSKPEFSSRESCEPSSSSAATSPSWFSTILHARRQNGRSIEDSAAARGQRQCEQSNPAISTENFTDEFNAHDRYPSGSECSSEESPQRRHHTPVVAPPSVRRSRLGSTGKSLSGMALCLSPLVRASPNRHWSQKGLGQELSSPVAGGAHHHISTAASFCANRSRKLADFGRVSRNR